MHVDIKILVVDDYKAMRRITKNVLKQASFTNIVEADSGSSALSELKSQQVDLILLDVNMPEMTGFELLTTLKKDPKLKHIPIIMITSEGQKKSVLDAIKLGAADYIVKPFEDDVLIKKIKKVIEKNMSQFNLWKKIKK